MPTCLSAVLGSHAHAWHDILSVAIGLAQETDEEVAAAQARIEAAAAAANAAKVAALTEQWGDAAGIAVEGMSDPDFNGVYRHDAAASTAFAQGWGPAGWPVGKNEHGKFLYHTARLDGWPDFDEWRFGDEARPDKLYGCCAARATLDGSLPLGEHFCTPAQASHLCS